jgi:dTDP-4-amino-4,6-dideoxygalactose transaminase
VIARTVPPAYAPILPLALLDRGKDPRGALVARLRDRFAADAVLLTGSGTEALRLAVRTAFRMAAARGTSAGLVAMPAFTCYDVAAAVLAETDRVTCFDVEPRTLAPEPESFAHGLGRGAAVAVVSPLYGQPIAWEPLAERARDAGSVLIEDAAQGHGATWRGRPFGALGELSVISFARGKGWTGGGGGALLARGRQAADALATPAAGSRGGSLRIAAGALAQWAFGRPGLYGIPASVPWLGLGATVYRAAAVPREMPEAVARLILASERAADEEAAIRRHRGAWLRERLDPSLTTLVPDGGVPGELRLPVLVPDSGRALGGRAAACGLARSYPRPVAHLAPVRAALREAGPWPGAERLARDLITAPTHSGLRKRDAATVLRELDICAAGAGAGTANVPERRDASAGTGVAQRGGS